MKIEGLIPKKVIRQWLENYQALDAGDMMLDALPVNSGAKSYDGVSGRFLNKIMLDAAIDRLPTVLKACVYCRWIYRKPLGETLRLVGLEKNQYYKCCDKAVTLIYEDVNGLALNYKNLYTEVGNN